MSYEPTKLIREHWKKEKKSKKPDVVCPTGFIFFWQNYLKKVCHLPFGFSIPMCELRNDCSSARLLYC